LAIEATADLKNSIVASSRVVVTPSNYAHATEALQTFACQLQVYLLPTESDV